MKLNFTLFSMALTVVFSGSSMAFEVFSIGPGSRALGMAGVFSGQADDNTAIWYNPGGLQREGFLESDFSIEFSRIPAGDDKFNSDSELEDNNNDIKYMGYYMDHLPFGEQLGNKYGFGVAYYSAYQLEMEIDRRRSIIDSTPFGTVDVSVKQFSLMISAQVRRNFSIGTTLDAVWTSVNCRDYSPCVKNGPVGLGLTAGVLYQLYQSERIRLNVAGVWRTRASIDYDSGSDSGIDSALDDYIPDRPETRNIGLGLQHLTSTVFVNYNFIVEKVFWSDAVRNSVGPSGAGISDYNNYGIGVEVGWPMMKGQSFSVRAGVKQSNSSNAAVSPDVETIAFGMGYGFGKVHFIDVGLNNRSVDSAVTEPDRTVSLSYSLQK